jgi:Putative transmembrane protein (PGPGW)
VSIESADNSAKAPLAEQAPSDLAREEMPVTAEAADLNRIKELPKEVGVMLIAAGIVGIILPGPGTPAVIAGGLALWPNAFGKLESWLERRYPEVHKKGMKQIGRFLTDLEKRYPNSIHR